MLYVGRVAGWCIYMLCRHSGRLVLICVMKADKQDDDHAGYTGNVTGE